MPQPRIKAAIVIDQLAQVEAEHGRAVIEAALARLPVEQANEMRAAVAMSWLEVPVATAMKFAVAAELGMDPLDFQRKIVRVALGRTIHSLWRVLLRQLWDSAVVARTPILYAKTFDAGQMEMTHISRGEATFVLRGWPEVPEYDCLGMAVGMEALLDYSGRVGASVAWRREPLHVEFLAKWTPS